MSKVVKFIWAFDEAPEGSDLSDGWISYISIDGEDSPMDYAVVSVEEDGFISDVGHCGMWGGSLGETQSKTLEEARAIAEKMFVELVMEEKDVEIQSEVCL
jgi:hypothetical protein